MGEVWRRPAEGIIQGDMLGRGDKPFLVLQRQNQISLTLLTSPSTCSRNRKGWDVGNSRRLGQHG